MKQFKNDSLGNEVICIQVRGEYFDENAEKDVSV